MLLGDRLDIGVMSDFGQQHAHEDIEPHHGYMLINIGPRTRRGLLTIATLPFEIVQTTQDEHAPSGLDIHGGKQGQIGHHGALQQKGEGPLNLVVIVRSVQPGPTEIVEQIVDGGCERAAGYGAGVTNPVRAHPFRQLVRSKLAGQPTQRGGDDGGYHEAAGPAKGALGHSG